jgi:predicted dehydrogenase
VEAFVASVRAGEILEPCATGEDGLRALEVALAGYASADRGAVVPLPLSSG